MVMTTHKDTSISQDRVDLTLSLYEMLDPEVLANPYPLYHRLRTKDPIHWDPFLREWVVTRYDDVVYVFHHLSAMRTPTPEQLEMLGLSTLTPFAQVMIRQMLFMDPPAHGRIRNLASKAFTARRVRGLQSHIQDITDQLLDVVQDKGRMDVIADLAYPLPAIVAAEMLGLPASDRHQLKAWSEDFAEMLGNFSYNADRAPALLYSLQKMCAYFHAAVQEHREHPRDDVISALVTSEQDGDRLTDEEVVANCIIIMVGGQETTTNLIGNGLLTLLRHPDQLALLSANPALIPSAVEELLRYESPIQYTTRIAQENMVLRGKSIHKDERVVAVMGAANRDPERFPNPDTLNICRQDNKHVAFAIANHFCFGAPLARLEGQMAFETVLRRMPHLSLAPGPITWRGNLDLRGLIALPVSF
jgi:pimeloyl-[acyl-carrier protein] synthase